MIQKSATENVSLADGGAGAFLHASGVTKIYGPTVANKDVQISISGGEVVGLVGANGAGKSTLMRVLSGVTIPDDGRMEICGNSIEWGEYNPIQASSRGIRVVYQELSLCTNLTVYENFYIEQSRHFTEMTRWRETARAIAKKALERVFPGNLIDVNAVLSTLTITQQQMVEIARAVSDESLRLLILDEPTSSLGAEQTNQLMQFIDGERQKGLSFIFITHRLSEIIRVADRVYVMQNGKINWTGNVSETSEVHLVQKMGEQKAAADTSSDIEGRESAGTDKKKVTGAAEIDTGVRVNNLTTDVLENISLDFSAGQIVGIAGLEGSGQRELIRTIFSPDSKARRSIEINGKIAYVTGDRKKEGIFPLWSIAKNMVMTKVAHNRLFRKIRKDEGKDRIDEWFSKLKIVSAGEDSLITSLSGGNQQKVLIARALMADADIIILDDPTRGVDINTKRDLYALLRQITQQGKLVIWYSSEDDEFTFCDKVVVMRSGRQVAILEKEEITKDAIIQASFSGEQKKKAGADIGERAQRFRLDLGGIIIPLATMVLIFVLSGILTPSVFSRFGIDLLIGGSIPLIFATLAQMYIIGLSMVDLGIGAFMGLTNVLGATLLFTHPLLGAVTLIGCIGIYALMGVLIHTRQIPAIIVTLGMSFVWTGIGYSIQNIPGGQAPGWLSGFFSLNSPIVPLSVILVIAAAVVIFFLYRTRYGTVLRGFGNNPQSMEQSGWSAVKAYAVGFAIAGVLGCLGGLSVTGITTASDVNATQSYTLLTVAAVVMGGGMLTGGKVSPLGAVFGAITLSLIGSLLGFLNISSNWVAAVQGGILILILALRLLRRGGEA